MEDLLKFTFNKKILSKVIVLIYDQVFIYLFIYCYYKWFTTNFVIKPGPKFSHVHKQNLGGHQFFFKRRKVMQ